MRKFLKKVNRGLIIGGIVLAGFIIFVVSDTISFKKNKPQIKDAVIAYTDAIAECAVTFSSEEDFNKEIDKLMNNYWCTDRNTNNSNNYYGLNINNYRNQLDIAKNETYSDKNSGSVTKWSAKPSMFSIRKAGPGYAVVEFSCDITAEFKGDPYLINPSDTMKVSDFVYYGSEQNVTDNLSQFSVTTDYELKMKYVDGEWKICQATSWGWSTPRITELVKSEGGNA